MRHLFVIDLNTKFNNKTMKRKLLYTLFLYMACFSGTFAQNETDVTDMAWEDFVEWMAEEEDEAVDEEWMELLHELHAQPLDINKVRREELEVLPFLNTEQIEAIVKYVDRNRPVESLGELMFVRELSKMEREMLRLFVEVKKREPSWREDMKELTMEKLLKRGRSEAVWRTDAPFYKKEGYKAVTSEGQKASPNRVYRGDRFRHAFRYSFSSMQHLAAGLNMEKDAGERGIDHVSGYVMVKDIGMLKSIIVGDYKMSFGKGLAVNTSMKYGKMMMLSSMDRMDEGFRKHSSTSESEYFRGGAATFQLKQWKISVFGSYRKGDGTYTTDSAGMSSLKTDGLHRTQLEHSKKNNLGITDFGGNIHWEHKGLQLSATGIATHLSVPLKPRHDTAASLYRLYNPHGQDFFVGSLAGTYRCKSLTFSGEAAYSNNDGQHGMATLGALRWRVNSTNSLMAVGRYYEAKFVSVNGKAFGENTAVQNEKGLFFGWTCKSVNNTVIDAYFDAMHFPWMKQNVSASSYGYEGMLQATITPDSKWSLVARYRIKTKQKDFTLNLKDGSFTTLEYNTNQNLKLQFNYNLSSVLSLHTSATGTFVTFGKNPNEKGFAVSENLRWHNSRTKFRFDLGFAYFHTDSYNARVYHYEPTLLYAFGSTSYYDKGFRTTLLASIPLLKESLFISAKFATTHYFNRNTIGSELEMINANHREDLQMQLRWKF